MSRQFVALPTFPLPPRDYSPLYMNDLIKAFNQFVALMMNPGEGRNTLLVLTDLQDNDVGLEVGSIYRHGIELRIAVNNNASVAGGELTVSLGAVTVDIS